MEQFYRRPLPRDKCPLGDAGQKENTGEFISYFYFFESGFHFYTKAFFKNAVRFPLPYMLSDNDLALKEFSPQVFSKISCDQVRASNMEAIISI